MKPNPTIIVAMAASLLFAVPGLAVAQDCCAEAAEAGAACCAVADSANSEAADVPWTAELLRNLRDPLTGEPAQAAFFLPYADDEAQVFARIYFASASSLETAKTHGLKELYERAYLTRADGTRTTYGRTRLDLDNTLCAVSGVGNKTGRKLALDETMAVNCTAGACSLGDGFSANYNAVKIGACCPSCIKMLVADPDKFLSNLQPEIDEALKQPMIFEEK